MSDARVEFEKAAELTIPYYVVTKFSLREPREIVLTTTNAQDVLSFFGTECDGFVDRYFITAFYERSIVTYTPDQFMILEDAK